MIKEKLGPGYSAESRMQHIDSAAAAEDIKYGLGVKNYSNDGKQVVVWDATSPDDIFRGFAQFSTKPGMDERQYNAKGTVSILRKGIIWLQVADCAPNPVFAGQKVAVVQDGNIIAADDVGALANEEVIYVAKIENSEIKSEGAAGDLVKVEVNLPSGIDVIECGI